MIYKIFRPHEWAALRALGTTTGAPIDVTDGFIHFSTAAQVAETAAKHFGDTDEIILVSVDDAQLGEDLKWEVSRGGADFPHLYRSMSMSDVVSHQTLTRENGSFTFPEELA